MTSGNLWGGAAYLHLSHIGAVSVPIKVLLSICLFIYLSIYFIWFFETGFVRLALAVLKLAL